MAIVVAEVVHVCVRCVCATCVSRCNVDVVKETWRGYMSDGCQR